jgi:hypothetical protein
MERQMAHQNRRGILPPEGDAFDSLADEVVATWVEPMARVDWPHRVELLGEIARLTANRPGLGEAVAAKLIRRLGGGTITCRAQAQFYLHSADESLQLAARCWQRAQG